MFSSLMLYYLKSTQTTTLNKNVACMSAVEGAILQYYDFLVGHSQTPGVNTLCVYINICCLVIPLLEPFPITAKKMPMELC